MMAPTQHCECLRTSASLRQSAAHVEIDRALELCTVKPGIAVRPHSAQNPRISAGGPYRNDGRPLRVQVTLPCAFCCGAAGRGGSGIPEVPFVRW